jgi:pyruvate/2-oxoglutarate dehydrogenase complex dihydrolipoamide acyltransferase (E2) component
MKTELIVPRLTYTMEFCVIEEFLVKSGDKVEKGQVIANVSVDKANVEFTAERDGYIQFACEEGDELKPTDIYGYIADTKEELDS